MSVVVDARESHRHQLPEHAAPRRLVDVLADAEHRQLIVLPAGDARAGLAAQHVDQVYCAETLPGAIDRGERLLRR